MSKVSLRDEISLGNKNLQNMVFFCSQTGQGNLNNIPTSIYSPMKAHYTPTSFNMFPMRASLCHKKMPLTHKAKMGSRFSHKYDVRKLHSAELKKKHFSYWKETLVHVFGQFNNRPISQNLCRN